MDAEIRVTTSHGPPCTQGWEQISAVLCGRSPPPFLSALGWHRPMLQSMPGHCAGRRGQRGFGGPLGSSREMDLEEPAPAVAPRRGQRRGRFGAVCRGISVRGDLDVVVTVKAFGGERPLPGVAPEQPRTQGPGPWGASHPPSIPSAHRSSSTSPWSWQSLAGSGAAHVTPKGLTRGAFWSPRGCGGSRVVASRARSREMAATTLQPLSGPRSCVDRLRAGPGPGGHLPSPVARSSSFPCAPYCTPSYCTRVGALGTPAGARSGLPREIPPCPLLPGRPRASPGWAPRIHWSSPPDPRLPGAVALWGRAGPSGKQGQLHAVLLSFVHLC